jgi:GT2 family glycosyltransferase
MAMPTQADLSVVLPNYNHAAYLPRSIEAILAQSVQPRELLLVDDASTDDSLAVMERYARRCPRITIIRNPANLGVVESCNRVVRQARGRYLYLGAADDLALPGLFEKSVALLEHHPQALISCGVEASFDDATHAVCLQRTRLARAARYFTPDEFAAVIGPRGIPGTSALYRRDAWLSAGGYLADLRWHADWFLHLVLAFRGGLCYLPEPLGLFRESADTFSHRGQRETETYLQVIAAILLRLLSSSLADVLPHFQASGVLGFFGANLVRAASRLPERDWPAVLPLINVLPPWELRPMCRDADPAVRALATLLDTPPWQRSLSRTGLCLPWWKAHLRAALPPATWRLASRMKRGLLLCLPGETRRWTRVLRKASQRRQ